MKKLTKYLLTALSTMLFIGCLGACGESHTPESPSSENTGPQMLATPENLEVRLTETSNVSLVWDNVENAEGYMVYVDGYAYEAEENYYDIPEVMREGRESSICVMAKGNGVDHYDSKLLEIKYTYETVTKGLAYNLLEDGTYEVDRSAEKKEGKGGYFYVGNIVIPDTYQGRPITQIASCAFGGAIRNLHGELLLPIIVNGVTTGVRLPSGLKTIGSNAFCNVTRLKTVDVPATVERIEAAAFCGDSNLTTVNISGNVTYFGARAFLDCSNLKKIVISDGAELEMGVFKNCTALKEIVFPKRLTAIWHSAFKNTAWYNEQPDGLLYAGNVLCGYKGEMPEGTVIKDLPSDVIMAGGAFEDCTELMAVEFPENGTSIGGMDVFSGCTNLLYVGLPKNLTSIPVRTFSGCTMLKSIILPESVTEIDNSAFSSSGLSSVYLPEGLLRIGENAFYKCASLKEIVIPDSVTYIGGSAFEGTGLKKVYLPNGLTSLKSEFSRCEDLSEILIPNSVTLINIAFLNCENLKSAYYEGTAEEWEKIEKKSKYSDPTYYGGTLYFYSEEAPTEEGNFWHYDENGDPVVW